MKAAASALIIWLYCLASPQAYAFGLAVSPTSVMLDSKNLYGYVELSNTSDYPKTFLVEFEDAGLGACLRVSPKQVNIAQGQTQVVRMQYTCAANTLPPNPLVFFVEQPRAQQSAMLHNQLDFRLRLGLKVKLQTNPTQSLF